MPSKTMNRSNGSEAGWQTRSLQRVVNSKAGARSSAGEAYAPNSGLRVGLARRRQQRNEGTGNGGVAEGNESVKTAAGRRGSQEVPEGMDVIRLSLSRRGSAPSSKRTRSHKVEMEALLAQQRGSTGRIGNGGVTKSKENSGTVGPRRGSEKTPESVRVVKRASGESEKEEQKDQIVVQKCK